MEDLEMETTESLPDDQPPASPEPEDIPPEHNDTGAGDAAPEDTGSDDTPGTEPETPEDESEENGSDEAEAEDRETEPGSEEPAEDTGTDETGASSADQADETVSGNDVITISGNAVIFPEDFDLSMLGGSESSTGDTAALTEAVEYQSNLIYGTSAVMVFLLGVIAGILLIHGFRLRRT